MASTDPGTEGLAANRRKLSELLQSRVRAQGSEPEAATDELDELLLNIVASAERMWPTFALPSDVFVTYLSDRLPDDVPCLVALRQTYASDLYLACACSRGNVDALAAFDDRCVGRLDGVLRKMGFGIDVSAEVKQEIRVRVLFGDGGRPEILDFRGRGDLRGWVRVMAVRQALRRHNRTRREVATEDEDLLHKMGVPGDPELDHAKWIYREEFKRAFEGALRALSDRERTLLRQHHVDGLTIDELGRLYRVHRSTAARLLVRAREAVYEGTRARMMSQLDVQSQDLDSILRMIQSQIDISLQALQGAPKR
jgi:RNA polymerase sigma-70 factor (ECF subfamily)